MSKRKRRRRRRSKRKKRNSGFGKSPSEGGKSSFIALVAGMTTTLVLGMWLYSFFFLNVVPEPNTEIGQKGTSASFAPLATKFDVFLKTATPDQLFTRLTEQRKEIKKTTSATTREYLLRQQNQVAERIVESKAASNVKEFATRTLLRNRKSLYGLHAL